LNVLLLQALRLLIIAWSQVLVMTLTAATEAFTDHCTVFCTCFVPQVPPLPITA
jgi:hypothetical protein